MSIDRTRATLLAFTHEVARRGPLERHLAPEVTFTAVATDQQIAGREAVARFIRTFCGAAFDSRGRVKGALVLDGQARLELDFIGTHTGEFQGVAATGRRVDVPCRLTLDFRDDQIVAMVGHLPIDQLLRQLRGADETD